MHSNKFNIEVKDSKVLDLFSGVGSFGLECLSRGASIVTFVENYKEVLPVLKKNISNMNSQDITSIIEKNIIDKFNFNIFDKKFDIIFIDPPYKEQRINEIIEIILEKKILSQNGILIIHRHKKDNIKLTNKLKIIEDRTYGISKILFGN
jgi:16S rRNA (guanine966-N2)-methyltransferase